MQASRHTGRAPLGSRPTPAEGQGHHVRAHPRRRPRQHGPQPCAGLSPARGLRDRRPDEPQHPLDGGQAARRAAGLSAVRGLRRRPWLRRGPTRSRSTPTPTPMRPTRSGPWRRAATSSARSRSRPTWPTREAVVAKARATGRKLVLGYILRVHPAWQKLIEIGRGLGKPLVMRMNLNQQSSGPAWAVHRQLMESTTPIVDCGVHYVDVMCQLTGVAAGAGARDRGEAVGRDHRSRTTATCTWCSRTARSAGTRPAGGR